MGSFPSALTRAERSLSAPPPPILSVANRPVMAACHRSECRNSRNSAPLSRNWWQVGITRLVTAVTDMVTEMIVGISNVNQWDGG